MHLMLISVSALVDATFLEINLRFAEATIFGLDSGARVAQLEYALSARVANNTEDRNVSHSLYQRETIRV